MPRPRSDAKKPAAPPETQYSSAPTPHPVRAERAFAPGLYVVATPIGNAADISLRALALLAAASIIACEDTRVTAKLLALHGIDTPMTPYHDHNAPRARPKLIERLKRGEIVALVSDAGTPLVSDPGYRLVREAQEAGLAVTALPGASSALCALVLSGLPSDRFLFAGFVPSRDGARRRFLAELAGVPATLVMLESAQRLPGSLVAMAEVLGPREAAVARELTKRFEEIRRAPLHTLAEHYAESGPPKGELVVVVAPPESGPAAIGEDELDTRLRQALAAGEGVSAAAARLAAQTGRPRRAIYARAVAISKEGDSAP